MKNTVIEFFQNLPESKPEQFNKAFELYRQSSNRSESTERVLNAMGYSDSSLNNLLYDLQKLHGITDIEKLPVAEIVETPDIRIAILKEVVLLTEPDFLNWLASPNGSEYKIEDLIKYSESVKNEKAIEVFNNINSYFQKIELLDQISNSTLAEIKETFLLGQPTADQLNEVLEFAESVKKEKAVLIIKDIIESLKMPDELKTDLSIVKDEALSQENEELKNQNDDLLNDNEDLISEKEDLQDENEELKLKLALKDAIPKISAESLRVEFPFLGDKDCPNELKILVADKITLWNEYLVLHDEALKAEAGEISLSKEELEVKAKRAVECFDENQKIYDELNAYKENGKVLGKHPLFRTLQLTREVEVMTNEQLINYKNSTAKFFSDNKKKLAAAEKAKDLPKIEGLKSKIEERTERLSLVNKKLGV